MEDKKQEETCLRPHEKEKLRIAALVDEKGIRRAIVHAVAAIAEASVYEALRVQPEGEKLSGEQSLGFNIQMLDEALKRIPMTHY